MMVNLWARLSCVATFHSGLDQRDRHFLCLTARTGTSRRFAEGSLAALWGDRGGDFHRGSNKGQPVSLAGLSQRTPHKKNQTSPELGPDDRRGHRITFLPSTAGYGPSPN